MAAENEGVCNFEVAVSALVEFLGAVRHGVLLQFRWPVEALSAHRTFMWIVLCVNRYDMAFQVTGVRAFVITVGTMVGLILLVGQSVLH